METEAASRICDLASCWDPVGFLPMLHKQQGKRISKAIVAIAIYGAVSLIQKMRMKVAERATSHV